MCHDQSNAVSFKLYEILEKAKLSQSKHRWLPGVSRGDEGMNRRNIDDFQGSYYTLHDTIRMDTCHYTFYILFVWIHVIIYYTVL